VLLRSSTVEVAASPPAVRLGPELAFQLHQAPDPGAVGAEVGLNVGGRRTDGGQVDAEQLSAPLQRRRDRPAQVRVVPGPHAKQGIEHKFGRESRTLRSPMVGPLTTCVGRAGAADHRKTTDNTGERRLPRPCWSAAVSERSPRSADHPDCLLHGESHVDSVPAGSVSHGRALDMPKRQEYV
jgi:hypothetical protein